MTMKTVKIFGRYVVPITTMRGQRDYYGHMNYWHSCMHNTNIRILNGDVWALVSLGVNPALMTDFLYQAIITERWKQNIFFVQNKETMKWGALQAELNPKSWT